MNAADRRRQRQLQHWQERHQLQAARGPKGIASSWYDRARMLASEQERQGNPEAWNDLARFLENYCARYGQ